MADEIRLVTFEGENVAPVNDALMWNAAIGDSGVIYGCETTLKNASTLHIAAGYGVICGRHFQIFESDIHVTLSSTGDLLGRLYVHMDLSDATEPIQLLIETAASLSPEEQDDNINIINGVWDMNLATFALNALTISNLQNVFSTVAGGGSSLIAGTETGATASQAYVAGQYIIWGSRLWEVIAPIASGDAFVIGSNLSTTSTTVGSELTQLNNSLTGIDIRLNTSSNQPEWSARGAGSWSPFRGTPSAVYSMQQRASSGTFSWNVTMKSADIGKQTLICCCCTSDQNNYWADNGMSCSGITLSDSPAKIDIGTIYAYGTITSTSVTVTLTKAVSSGPDQCFIVVF